MINLTFLKEERDDLKLRGNEYNLVYSLFVVVGFINSFKENYHAVPNLQ